jgi:putative toxin-antitoxin system antitoxin component (TIGR02293 family)
MLTFSEVAGVLGLPVRDRTVQSPVALISRIENGLPITALDRVARLLAPANVQFKYRLVPKATYERRKVAYRLSADESARLARVTRAWAVGLDIWKNEETTRAFLFRPHSRSKTGVPSTW